MVADDIQPMTLSDLRARLAALDVMTAGLVAVIVGQAVWLGYLMRRGWYFQADFDNLSAATGHRLGWAYLTKSQGGHLDPIGRLVLWILNRTVPLNYSATIVIRLLATALATYLLFRLLTELVGRRRGVLAVVALFAISPLLVQSTLWLTSSINFLGSELLVLAGVRAYLRYVATLRWRWAVYTSLAFFGGILVSEQSAVSVLLLPILCFAFLSSGTMGQRTRTLFKGWRVWLLIAAPLVAFGVYFKASGRYAQPGRTFGPSDAFSVVGHFFYDTLIPGMFGGPFAWLSYFGNNFALSDPPAFVSVLALVAFVACAVWTAQRTSLRALWGWALPLIIGGIGMVAVGAERVELFSAYNVSRRFEYAAYAAVPAAIGVAVALWPPSVARLRAQFSGGPAPESPLAEPTSGRMPPLVADWWRLGVVAIAVFSLISGATYAEHWSKAPAKRYVHNLRADLDVLGGGATVLDTYVSSDVMPGIQFHRHVSDLLHLMGAHAYINNGPSQAMVVGPDGHLVEQAFFTAATAQMPTGDPFCNDLVKGQLSRTRRILTPLAAKEWFVRLTYFQKTSNVINVQVLDSKGKAVGGTQQVLLSSPEGYAFVRVPSSQPAAIKIQGAQPDTNVCFTNLAVGYPFPAK